MIICIVIFIKRIITVATTYDGPCLGLNPASRVPSLLLNGRAVFVDGVVNKREPKDFPQPLVRLCSDAHIAKCVQEIQTDLAELSFVQTFGPI